MIRLKPTVEEERLIELGGRAESLVRDGRLTQDAARPLLEACRTPWRAERPRLEVAFFFLTAIGLAAFVGLVEILQLPRGPITLVCALAAAEWLILDRRFFGTGIESALWIGALVTFITSLPSEGKPEALLVFAAAFALTSWRVSSPVFGTIATLLVVAYAGVKDDAGIFVLAGALSLAAVAALMLLVERRRPWLDRLLGGIVLTVIPAGYVASKFSMRGFHTSAVIVVLFAVVAATLAGAGLWRRSHALLLAAFVSLLIALTEFQDLVAWSAEAKLLVGGALLFGSALVISRALRGREHGFVAHEERLGDFDEIGTAALGAAAALRMQDLAASTDTAPAAPERAAGDGKFGGAGSTGDF